MNRLDKKALKSAGLITAIVLFVFEEAAFLVQLLDPEGGLLRVKLRPAALLHGPHLPDRRFFQFFTIRSKECMFLP